MLTKNEFDVMLTCYKHQQRNECSLLRSDICSIEVFKKLIEQGYISQSGELTYEGLAVLAPYKVRNAVILAAGFSSRCAPLSYEKPKGLFIVKGEVLIERQIKQLQERGINEIYVVVGYMKELFFYLEQKFDVHIVTNSEYYFRNNLSSVYAIKKVLGNSYICYSDNYIIENNFEPYVYTSYFSALYSEGYTSEYVMEFDSNDKICQYYIGGEKCWYQMGEMYFSDEVASRFIDLLEKEYTYPSIYDMKIDDFYIRHLSSLDISIYRCPQGAVMEFDTIAEIEKFDDQFFTNMGENILSNICGTLCCSEKDVVHIQQIKRGMTNTIFSFECKGDKYIYRHPGTGTEKIIDRGHELKAQLAAQRIGLDPTLIKADTKKGWKICKYIENMEFRYDNLEDEKRGIEAIRSLHANPIRLGWEFNMVQRAEDMQKIVSREHYNAYTEFETLRENISSLYQYILADGYPFEMCHNDVCDTNILLGRDRTYIIDWEYAGDNDPASDICSYIIGTDRSKEDCDRILQEYFKRSLTYQEKRHFYGFIAVSGYFYFSWALFKESKGQDVGDFTYRWYRFALTYGKLALEMYKEES